MSKAELVNYNGWVNIFDKEYLGKYKNEEGLPLEGIYCRDYKNTIHMIFIHKGNVQGKYIFPKVEIPFNSLMVSWENLWMCGGYYGIDENGEKLGSKENIIQAVINRKKPMGFAVDTKQVIDNLEEVAKQSGLPYEVYPLNRTIYNGEELWELGICQHGTVSNHFDLDALIKSYEILGSAAKFEVLDSNDIMHIRQLNDKTLSSFLTGWDYANPGWRNWELVKTGLLLGYAVESTFDRIWKQ